MFTPPGSRIHNLLEPGVESTTRLESNALTAELWPWSILLYYYIMVIFLLQRFYSTLATVNLN